MGIGDLLLQTTQDTIVALANLIFSLLPSPSILPVAVNTSLQTFFDYLYSLDLFLDLSTFMLVLQFIIIVELYIFLFKLGLWLARLIRG